MNKLKIKVCGLKYINNIRHLVNEVKPDYIGFIFYPLSSRFAPKYLNPKSIRYVPERIKKTGVFVNESREKIRHYVENYQLDAVQLHGQESPELCKSLQESGLEVVKSFSFKGKSTLSHCRKYMDVADYFLFDTPGPLYGGNGSRFNWLELKEESPPKPYFLSGGIDLEDAYRIQHLLLPNIYGVDINSRFEISPGKKDIKKIMKFSEILIRQIITL